MKRLAIILALFLSIYGFSQSNRNPGGQFSLGVRSTASLFTEGSGIGMGYGGQFRLRFYNFLNSEWFADYLSSGIDTIGNRQDFHIGWSVMFYIPSTVAKTKLYHPVPYFLAGHCFDYTRIRGNSPAYSAGQDQHRWSSAVQAGLGFHLPVTYRIDLSMSAQYMMHLGKEIGVETHYAGANSTLAFLHLEKPGDAALEGHLLITFSMNFRLADFWKDKKGALGNGPHVQPDDQQQQ